MKFGTPQSKQIHYFHERNENQQNLIDKNKNKCNGNTTHLFEKTIKIHQ